MTDRTCIVTREILDKEAMMRFVFDDTGRVYPDIKGTLPGRGAWVRAEQTIVEQAIKTKAFARSFKKNVLIDNSLPILTETLLRKNALGALAMARKAGSVITGGLKIEKAAQKSKLFLILHSEAAALEGKRKIANCLKIRQDLNLRPVPIITLFTHEDLQKVFGEKYVMHVALFHNPVSENFLAKVKKLQFYRGCTIKNTSSAVKE